MEKRSSSKFSNQCTILQIRASVLLGFVLYFEESLISDLDI